MPFLKGNYEVTQTGQTEPIEPDASPSSDAGSLLEQEYYKAALTKLGGSIAFVMKGRTFVWHGDSSKEDSSPKE